MNVLKDIHLPFNPKYPTCLRSYLRTWMEASSQTTPSNPIAWDMAVTMSLEKSLCPGASSATELWLAVAELHGWYKYNPPTSLSHYWFGVRNYFNTCNILQIYNIINLQFVAGIFAAAWDHIHLFQPWGEIQSLGPANSGVRLANFHVHMPAKPLQANPKSNLQSPRLQHFLEEKGTYAWKFHSKKWIKCSTLNPNPIFWRCFMYLTSHKPHTQIHAKIDHH